MCIFKFGTQTNAHTAPSKVDAEGRKQGPLQQAGGGGRGSTLRTFFTTVSDFFKPQRTQKVVAGAAEHSEIEQLRQEITVLQNRCADLEGANYSAYGSYRSSTLDVRQDLRKPDADMSRSIVSRSEDSESKRTTTDVVVQVCARLAMQDPNADAVDHAIQAGPISPETNGQAVPASQGPAGAEGNAGAKVAIQPTMPSRTKDGPSSPPADQNLGGVSSATQGATAAVRADSEEGLSETDKVSGDVQFSQTDLHRLPRKMKKDEGLGAEVIAESEARPGYIDPHRLPRKKQGNEEVEVETLPPLVRQERLPRKKESEESDGGRSG